MKMKSIRLLPLTLALMGVLFMSKGLLAQNCVFSDCTSTECGNSPDYTSEELYEAAQYLCDNGIVGGIEGYLLPNENITREQLAKIALYGLYGGVNNVPTQLVTDYFPCIYPDLQENSYYFKAAKALLYLEYGDGISPFDRDRDFFDPEAPIERCYVLKVLLETFNVVPEPACMENPFMDFDPNNENYGNSWGYANKAYALNIVRTETFRPGEYCTRGEAFVFLYRMMTSQSIAIPVPSYDLDPSLSDFFIPINLKPEVLNEVRGLEQGNFSFYEKDFFHIPGYVPLDFGISYDSYQTEIPQTFLPIEPLGPSWTHNYNIYLRMARACDDENKRVYVVHMEDGSLLMYEPEPFSGYEGECASITKGNHNKLRRYETNETNETYFILETTDHYSYKFQKLYDPTLFYLTQIVEDLYHNKIDLTWDIVETSYNSIGPVLTSVSALGRSLVFDYYENGKLKSVTDPIGRQVTFNYDDNRYLSSIQDAKGNVTNFQYGTTHEDKGLITCIELPKGNKIYNDYQQRKLQSTRYDDDPPTTIELSLDYVEGNSSSTLVQPLAESRILTTNYGFNLDNRITSIKELLDNNQVNKDISYFYDDPDDSSLVTSVIDNIKNLQTNYSYTNAGLIATLEIVSEETLLQHYDYNPNGTLASMTDFNGNTTSFSYVSSLSWKVSSVVDALGNTTTIEYNDHGAPSTITNPMGKVTQYGYNSYGNLIRYVENPLGIVSETSYDAISRVISTKNSNGKTRYYEYDDNDNITKVTDELGYSTSDIYDENDNLIKIINSKGYATNLTYDIGDLLESVSFEGSTISMEYNPDGSLKRFTSPKGDQFNYVYDAAGRLSSDGYASYSYNNLGMIEYVTKDGKSITYEYNNNSRHTIKSITYDGNMVKYSFDKNGNVKTITYPGEKVVTYKYDALNRVESVTDWNDNATSFVYRPDGLLDFYTYPNEVRTYYYYDENGRHNGLASYRSNGLGGVIASESFSLDNIGNIIQEDFVQPFETLPPEIASFLTYTYNSANRLETMGGISFLYDANGNTTSRTGREYSYDSKDNLIEVSGDFTATYTYDGLGNRRTATRDGETTKYVLDLLSGDGNVIMETDDGGIPVYYYVYGPAGLISRISANDETEYYIYDYRGSTIAMVDATTDAAITHKYQYDDFGNVVQSEETDLNRFRYVGRNGAMFETDDLAFMRARYYDSQIGRFLSEDPIWSNNLYVYADNNPINNFDPNGTMSIGVAMNIMSISSLGLGVIDLFMPNTTGGNDVLSKTFSGFADYANIYSTGCFMVGMLSKVVPSLKGVSALVNGLSGTWLRSTVSGAFHFHPMSTIFSGSVSGAVPIIGWCLSAFSLGWSIGTIIGEIYGDEITQWFYDRIIKKRYNKKKRDYQKSTRERWEWEDVFIPRCGY